MPDQAAFSPVQSATTLSQWQRVVNLFIAPDKTFSDIRRNTSWWLPWIITSVLILAFAFAAQQKVGWPQVYTNVLSHNPKAMQRMQQAPPDRVAAAMSIGVKATEISFFAQPVLILIGGLIIAVILWGTLNFLFGAQARYGEILSVWFYSALPMALLAILAIITLYSGLDPSTFYVKNPVGTNIGYYLSSDTPRWLVTLLTSVDVLKIWTAILLTLGCAKVARIKKSQAAFAVFGWWIIIIIVSVGFTAI